MRHPLVPFAPRNGVHCQECSRSLSFGSRRLHRSSSKIDADLRAFSHRELCCQEQQVWRMQKRADAELSFTWFSARKGLQYEGTTKQVFLRLFSCASMQHTGTQQSIEHLHPSLELVPGDLQEEPVTQRVIDENRKIIQKLEEVNNRVEDVYLTELAQINSIWHSSKLDLVPDDYLLDMVCQKYGVRYKKKEQDGSRLASLMYEHEIDREIRDIIQAISRGHH